MSPILEVADVEVAYGKIKAVKGISFTVEEGQLVSLIGTNGAGKTTTLRTISGLHQPAAGTITFRGDRIDKLAAHTIVQHGLAHVPEGRRIFPRMAVEENLTLGAYARRGQNTSTDLKRVYELFPVLHDRRKQHAGTFSGGEQQMLAIGRALMSAPTLLMLDEPSMGLSPIMMARIVETLTELRQRGTTILLVEQNAQAALELADYGHVLEVGTIVLSDTGTNLLGNPDVRKAYLGED
ncbi:MAG: ATP-binding cassette domain-containing protein [Streptosporangiales bacterium]|nr:ATP-binding cassette domain-containing protein [Streptosporangiales bacterium]